MFSGPAPDEVKRHQAVPDSQTHGVSEAQKKHKAAFSTLPRGKATGGPLVFISALGKYLSEHLPPPTLQAPGG